MSNVETKDGTEVLDGVVASILTASMMREFLPAGKIPQVVAINTSGHDGVVYSGRIVVDPGTISEKGEIEGILHQLKHCFMGDYEKAQSWMVEEFRANSGKHSRISIAYYVWQNREGQLVTDFYRSMAEGASGAHQLRKITSPYDMGGGQYEKTTYKGNKYYAMPMTTGEANRLMNLFATMVVEAFEDYWFELAVRSKPAAGGMPRKTATEVLSGPCRIMMPAVVF